MIASSPSSPAATATLFRAAISTVKDTRSAVFGDSRNAIPKWTTRRWFRVHTWSLRTPSTATGVWSKCPADARKNAAIAG